jgi:hypothetical protein
MVWEFFRRAQVYALATCSPQEFTAEPSTDRLVHDQVNLTEGNRRSLTVSTRRKVLVWKAWWRRADLQMVVVEGSWLLANLENNTTVIIDEGFLRSMPLKAPGLAQQ